MNFCVSFLPWIWHPSNIFVRNLSFLLSCLLFNENLPRKFPRKSREIGRFLREFVSSNPVKFHFFPANYQKPCKGAIYLDAFFPQRLSLFFLIISVRLLSKWDWISTRLLAHNTTSRPCSLNSIMCPRSLLLPTNRICRRSLRLSRKHVTAFSVVGHLIK